MLNTIALFLTLLIGAPTQSPVARSYIASSGSIVEIFAGSDPTLGPVVPAYINAVTANPQFTLNGAPVSVQGPFWHSAAKNAPMVAYQLPNPVGAADVVTWSAPAGWLTTNLGTCGPGVAVTCENYSGASGRAWHVRVSAVQSARGATDAQGRVQRPWWRGRRVVASQEHHPPVAADDRCNVAR